MRSVIYGVGVSVDGYIARPDGTFDFLFMPKDFSMAEFFASIDTAIMGRKTYEVAKTMGGGKSGSKIRNYVFSRSLPTGERDGFIFVNQSPESLIKTLREKIDKDKDQGKGKAKAKTKAKVKTKNIWLMGGGELAHSFLAADLVDEIHLGVVPVLLGAGLPAFPAGFPQRNFELMENKSFSRGLISLKYKRAR